MTILQTDNGTGRCFAEESQATMLAASVALSVLIIGASQRGRASIWVHHVNETRASSHDQRRLMLT
jgi:hypothetical protein